MSEDSLAALDVPGHGEPFAHDHTKTPDLEEICVR
jgi:hypothetical protein